MNYVFPYLLSTIEALLSDPEILHKYVRGLSLLHSEAKARYFNVWKCISEGLEIIRQGTKWRIEGGSSVRFWADVLLGDKPLFEISSVQVNEHDKDLMVSDLISNEGEWDLGRLHTTLPEDIKHRILGTPKSVNSGSIDTLI